MQGMNLEPISNNANDAMFLAPRLSSRFSSSSWWDKTVPLFSWAWQNYEESLLPHSFLQTPRRETYRALCCTSCMQFTLAARNFIKSNSIFFVCFSWILSKFFLQFPKSESIQMTIHRHFSSMLYPKFVDSIVKTPQYAWKQLVIKDYCKVESSRLSRLVAHQSIFRMLMKGKFDAYVLWPLAKSFQNWIVDRSTACDFTILQKVRIEGGRPRKLFIPIFTYFYLILKS